MKKITILVFMLALSSLLMAQIKPISKNSPPKAETSSISNLNAFEKQNSLKGGGDIFWEEQFDWGDTTSILGWLLPADWSLEDPSDVGYNWHWANDSLIGPYTAEGPIKSTSSHNGFLALNAAGYNQDFGHWTEFLNVNNSITSPKIDCSAHSSVLVRIEQNFRANTFESQHIFEVTNDNGVHWASFDMKMGTLVHERVAGLSNGDKVDLILNITDVAAGLPEVQFRITWRDASLYHWMIDDIAFMEGWDYDLQLLLAEADYDNGLNDQEGFFYAIPHTQISAYQLMGVIKNFGNLEQWGTHINATVTKNNEVIWDQNSNSIVSYPLAVDTLRFDEQYTPEEFGHYQFDYSLLSENEDELPADNSASMSFMVTDSLFSRCDEEAEASFSTWEWYDWQHEGDMMGVHYTIVEDIEINSIAAYISSADILCSFRMILFGIEEETGNYLEILSSDYIDMDSTILQNHWVTVPLDKDGEGEFLQAGNTYLAAIELSNNLDFEDAYYSNRYYLGSDRDNFFTSGTSVMYWSQDDAWYSVGEDLLMIRMHFNDDSNIVDNVDVIDNDTWLSQNYPNPFDVQTNISYFLTESGPVEIIVLDQLGKEVIHKELGEKLAGRNEYILSGDGLEAGIYYYSIKSGTFKETKRMVVK